MGEKMLGVQLKNGFKGNHRKHSGTITRVQKQLKGNPIAFEKLWREYVFNEGGDYLARVTVDEIVNGNKFITDMENYQDSISDYNLYSIAMYMADTKVIPSQDILSDSFANKLNDAFISFGYSDEDNLPYTFKTDEDGEIIFEDKLLINPNMEINKDELSKEDYERMQKVSKKYAAESAKYNIDTSFGSSVADEKANKKKKEKFELPIIVTPEAVAEMEAWKKAKKEERKHKKNKEEEVTEDNITEETSTKKTSTKEIIDVEGKIIEAEEVKETPKAKEVKESLKETIDDPFAAIVNDIVDTANKEKASAQAKAAQKEGAKSTKSSKSK